MLADVVKPLLGESIVNFDGEMHRRLSAILVPVLKRTRLEIWIPLLQRKADSLIHLWKVKAALSSPSSSDHTRTATKLQPSAKSEAFLAARHSFDDDYQLLVMDFVNSVILASDVKSTDNEVISLAAEAKNRGIDISFASKLTPIPPTELAQARDIVAAIQHVNTEFAAMSTTPLPPILSKLRLRLSPTHRRHIRVLRKRVEHLFRLARTITAPEDDDESFIDERIVSKLQEEPSVKYEPDVLRAAKKDLVDLELFRHTCLFRFGRAVETGSVSQEMALDNLLGLGSAAGETGIATLCWLTHFLSKNPHVQDRCREELRLHGLMPLDSSPSVLPDLTADALAQLVYHEAVIKETFRLGLATVGAFRVTSKATDLLGGVPLNKDQQIMWIGSLTHRLPQEWSDQSGSVSGAHLGGGAAVESVFAPERFVDPAVLPSMASDAAQAQAAGRACGHGADQQHHPYAWIPFGGGVHGCPGRHFGFGMVKTVLARMMQSGVEFEDTQANKGEQHSKLSIFPKDLTVNIRIPNPQTPAS